MSKLVDAIYGERDDLEACDIVVFSPEQVANLWRWQMQDGIIAHPFTCPNRSDGKHIEIGSDLGMLVPTKYGWLCPFCEYRQRWAHDFMLNGQPDRTQEG